MIEPKPRQDDANPVDVNDVPDIASPGGAPFKVGDRVRLRALHRKHGTIPAAGIVSAVQHFGSAGGQLIVINHRKVLGGYYELEPRGA